MQLAGIVPLLLPPQCFNPHPARRPDAMGVRPAGDRTAPNVSILTRPEGRMQLTNRDATNLYTAVSILTRPEGRMQSLAASATLSRPTLFQSSPGQKAGCNTVTLAIPYLPIAFQSSPGQKAGCNASHSSLPTRRIPFQSSPGQKAGCNTGVRIGKTWGVQVSILTRPEGRMQYWSLRSTICLQRFQSSPGQKAGCNLIT